MLWKNLEGNTCWACRDARAAASGHLLGASADLRSTPPLRLRAQAAFLAPGPSDGHRTARAGARARHAPFPVRSRPPTLNMGFLYPLYSPFVSSASGAFFSFFVCLPFFRVFSSSFFLGGGGLFLGAAISGVHLPWKVPHCVHKGRGPVIFLFLSVYSYNYLYSFLRLSEYRAGCAVGVGATSCHCTPFPFRPHSSPHVDGFACQFFSFLLFSSLGSWCVV